MAKASDELFAGREGTDIDKFGNDNAYVAPRIEKQAIARSRSTKADRRPTS